MNELERIIRLLNKTFDKGAWHGPTVKEVLQNVSQEQAYWRAGTSHSIIELVLHMTSWKLFAAARLRGDESYQVAPDMNFPEPGSLSWAEACRRLETSHNELIDAARGFEEDRLGELVPSSSFRYTYYTLLHGITHHDLYHAGQIQLILKANHP
ncbi:MAG: DinB family protein [Cyclobacteriaceae bacterium]|nr:DinB family protein [Cyclobacteriaceae bacterium]